MYPGLPAAPHAFSPSLPQVVKYAIDHNMVEVLWANDQLHAQQKKGKVLQVGTIS